MAPATAKSGFFRYDGLHLLERESRLLRRSFRPRIPTWMGFTLLVLPFFSLPSSRYLLLATFFSLLAPHSPLPILNEAE